MVRIDAFVFGYRKLQIDPSELSLITSILLRRSIPSVINNDGTITVRERDIEKIKDLLSGRVEYTCSEPLGIPGMWKRMPYKVSVIISCVISILSVLYLSGLVWDIRVEGNERMTDKEIIIALNDCGFEIGDFWRLTDSAKIENVFLEKNDRISWININRRGSVAYIKVIEKEEGLNIDNDASLSYSNIVANVDCVIEDITVKRGVAMVKVGDSVKKGDILVAGVLSSEAGGFCAADATVIGRVSETVRVEIDRVGEKNVNTNKKIYSITLNFFKISLNIFKLYGNLTEECAIIEDEIAYSLFDKYKLPLSISVEYLAQNLTETVEYTDEELVKMASERLRALTISTLVGSDLLKINTRGGFIDSGYYLSSELVFLSVVGERVQFDVE